MNSNWARILDGWDGFGLYSCWAQINKRNSDFSAFGLISMCLGLILIFNTFGHAPLTSVTLHTKESTTKTHSLTFRFISIHLKKNIQNLFTKRKTYKTFSVRTIPLPRRSEIYHKQKHHSKAPTTLTISLSSSPPQKFPAKSPLPLFIFITFNPLCKIYHRIYQTSPKVNNHPRLHH